MIGYHAVAVIADAYLKGIRGYDADAALEAMVATASYAPYGGLGAYMQLGYVPIDEEGEAASKTLEYAFDDWTSRAWRRPWAAPSIAAQFFRRAAQLAQRLRPGDRLHARAPPRRQLPHPVRSGRQRLRQRLHRGQCLAVLLVRAAGRGGTGARARRRAAAARAARRGVRCQDRSAAVRAHGGHHRPHRLVRARQRAEPPRRLPVRGRRAAVAHAGAPRHDHGEPVRAAPRRAGPATTTSARCRRGTCSPRSASTRSRRRATSTSSAARSCRAPTLHLPNGRHFTVSAPGLDEAHPYVGAVTLNGQPLTRVFIRHEEIMAGGELVFTMQATPNRAWPGRARASRRTRCRWRHERAAPARSADAAVALARADPARGERRGCLGARRRAAARRSAAPAAAGAHRASGPPPAAARARSGACPAARPARAARGRGARSRSRRWSRGSP